MLLVGMLISAIVFALLLINFSQIRLIQVIQGAAVATLVLNLIALWKQEARDPKLTKHARPIRAFRETLRDHCALPGTMRRLTATALGTAAFSMQDVLLEPYAGQVLGLSIAATTGLTALLAASGITGLTLAAQWLGRGLDPHRLAAHGLTIGLAAFSLVVFSAPLTSTLLLVAGVALIGFGGGLFAHGTLTAAMNATRGTDSGIALGAWGSVQATAAGSAIAIGSILRDAVSTTAVSGELGTALADPTTGYTVVFHIELALMFAALVAVGPLVRPSMAPREDPSDTQRQPSSQLATSNS